MSSFRPLDGSCYTVKEIQALEAAAMQAQNCSLLDLMHRAGQAAFEVLQATWPNAKKIRVVCGRGNNAGDGLVVAQLAAQAGFAVEVVLIYPLADLSSTAQQATEGYSIPTAELDADSSDVDVIVDALLGTGCRAPLPAEIAQAIEHVNTVKKPVLSLDIPSGVIADSGDVADAVIKASVTVTFLGRKRGLYTGKAIDFVGDVVWHDIGVGKATRDQVLASVALLSSVRHQSTARRIDSHKGDHGHVLVIGGAKGMGGAPVLAALAAQRVGAGRVSLLTHPDHVSGLVAAHPSIMTYGYETAQQAIALLAVADVVAIGPGLGQEAWGQALLELVHQHHSQRCVLDADALNLMAAHQLTDWREPIITPHPGEAARLLDTTIDRVQADRFTTVSQLAERLAGVAVLKGAGTLVADNQRMLISDHGDNRALAVAGMGDLLTGVIAGQLAQGLPVGIAAQRGVWVSGCAAQAAVQQLGSYVGLIPEDILQYLPAVSRG